MKASNHQGSERVELGRFGKVFGIKGWIRLNSYTNPPDTICSYEALSAEIAGKQIVLELDEYRTHGNGLVVHVKGYDNPEAAKALTGKGIWIEAKDLPPLPAGEFYWHQLIGLQVINQHGAVFGNIVELLETGANDVLLIVPNAESIDQRERMIPYLRDSVVLKVDLAAGWMRVEWEADYLE